MLASLLVCLSTCNILTFFSRFIPLFRPVDPAVCPSVGLSVSLFVYRYMSLGARRSAFLLVDLYVRSFVSRSILVIFMAQWQTNNSSIGMKGV